jgi:hypothetical protein
MTDLLEQVAERAFNNLNVSNPFTYFFKEAEYEREIALSPKWSSEALMHQAFARSSEAIDLWVEAVSESPQLICEAVYQSKNKKVTDKLMDVIASSSEFSYYLGLQEELIGTEEQRQRVVEKVAEDPSLSSAAIDSWVGTWTYHGVEFTLARGAAKDPEIAFNLLKEGGLTADMDNILFEGLFQSPEWSYNALTKLGHLYVFKKNDEKLVDAVAKSPEWSYRLLSRNFKESIRNASVLVASVLTSPKWSYEAGLSWDDKQFEDYSQKICISIAQSEHYVKESRSNWWGLDDRLYCLESVVHPNPTNSYFDAENIEAWKEMAMALKDFDFIGMPKREYELLERVYKFVQDIGKNHDLMLKSLPTVIEQDNVQIWATTIIDGLTKPETAIGGDSYERVS